MNGVVVVGAGVAGVRAAESLRAAGCTTEITIIGDEAPFYRPVASKDVLLGSTATEFPMPLKRAESDFTWRLGARVVSADIDKGLLRCSEAEGQGFELGFQGLVIASGLRPRRLPVPGSGALTHALRSLAEARTVAARLTQGARVTIIGSGFVGCEVAAAARSHGCEVTVISPEPVPLADAVGETLGGLITRRHLEHGVRFVFERSVVELRGDEHQVDVMLDDGQVLESDLVLEAVGSVPNVEWLAGNGLETVNGVRADGQLRAIDTSAAVVVCGDVACHPHALYPGTVQRIEHWTAAGDAGSYAGRALHQLLQSGSIELPPFAALPSFWSDQYDAQLQSFGVPQLATEQTIVELNEDGSCIVEFRDDAQLLAVAGINRTAALAGYRKQLISR